MEPDFDSMSLGEMLKFRIDNQVVIPEIGDLLAADVARIRDREKELGGPIPEDEIVIVPVGKQSFTVATKHYEQQFRQILKDAYLTPKSRKGFEILRQDIVAMSFQDLVNFNSYRNLVGEQSLQELFDREDARVPMGPGRTETIQRNGCTMAFTPAYVNDLREAMIAAVDQKEKDFINERSS